MGSIITRDGLQCHLAMHCDHASLAAYKKVLSLTQPVRAQTPAERVGEVWSAERGFGAGVVLRELFRAALGARPRAVGGFPPALPGSGSRGTQEGRSQQQR